MRYAERRRQELKTNSTFSLFCTHVRTYVTSLRLIIFFLFCSSSVLPVILLILFTIVNCVNLGTQRMIQKYIHQHNKVSIRSNYVCSVCTYVRIFSIIYTFAFKTLRFYHRHSKLRSLECLWFYTENLHGIIRKIRTVLYGKSAETCVPIRGNTSRKSANFDGSVLVIRVTYRTLNWRSLQEISDNLK